MSILTSGEVSHALWEESQEAQRNPRDIFGVCHFGEDWPLLNWLTRGLQKNVFTVFAARPKVGKSTLISQWVPTFAKQAKDADKVLRIITLETTTKTYLQRTAAHLAGIKDPLRIRAGRLDEQERRGYGDALAFLGKLPIEFLSNEMDLNEYAMTDEEIIASMSSIGLGEVERFVRNPNTFLWVVDHMGLINRTGLGRNTTEGLEAIANRLTVVANKYVGGIGITHTNRAGLDGGAPGLENLAGTDVFARNAGCLIRLWRPFFEAKNKTEEDLALMAAMGGDPGLLLITTRSENTGSVGIAWDNAYAGFYETDRREGEIPLPGKTGDVAGVSMPERSKRAPIT